jgi:hypothetical protein
MLYQSTKQGGLKVSEKVKAKCGPFIAEGISVDLNEPGAVAILKEAMEGCTPAGRVAQLRPHAERLGTGLAELNKAEELIPKEVTDLFWDWERFDLFMERAQRLIERRQFELNEEKAKPKLNRDAARQKGASEGGANSGRGRRLMAEIKRDEVIEHANVLIARCTEQQYFGSMIKERYENNNPGKTITTRTVRDILKENGIYKSK